MYNIVSASEVTTIWRYTNVYIIIIITIVYYYLQTFADSFTNYLKLKFFESHLRISLCRAVLYSCFLSLFSLCIIRLRRAKQ